MSKSSKKILVKKFEELEIPKKEEVALEFPPAIDEPQTQEVESSSSDESVDIQKKPPKEKKPRTDAQMAQFQKALQVKRDKAEARRKENEIKLQEEKKELENKLVQKAIAVKKKQIRKQKVIDDISDGETEVKKVAEKPKVTKPIVPTHKFSFI